MNVTVMYVYVVCISGCGHRLGGSPGSQPGSDLQCVHNDRELAENTSEACPGVTLQGKRP